MSIGPQDPTRSVATRTPPPEPEKPPPLVPGFTIQRKLGQGGQGSVYLAELEGGLKKLCALKVFPREAKESYARELEAFRRVEEIRRSTGTPHLVEGYNAGTTDDGLAFVAMAYFEHGSLGDRLVQDGPFASPQACRYARHVLAALELMHKNGIFHRDVKPQNVLLGNDGIARLGDYGLSKKLGTTITGSCTPAYAAPEQLAGEEDQDGVRIDIYGVGAMLFALLTGKPPIPGRTDIFLLEKKKVPRPVHGPLIRALHPDPAKRWENAGEFALALGRAEPTTSSSLSVAELAGSFGGDASGFATPTPNPDDATHASKHETPITPDTDPRRSTTKPAGLTVTSPAKKKRRAQIIFALAGITTVFALVAEAQRQKSPPRPVFRPPEPAPVVPEVADPRPTTKPADVPQPVPVRREVVRDVPLAAVRALAGGEALAALGSASVLVASGNEFVVHALKASHVAVLGSRAVVSTKEGVRFLDEPGLVDTGPGRVVALAAASRWLAVARRSDRTSTSVRMTAVTPEPSDASGGTAGGAQRPTSSAISERGAVLGLAFDAPGDRLAVASIDPAGASRIAVHRIFSAEEPRLIAALEQPSGPLCVAWAADQLVVGTALGEVVVVDLDGRIRRRIAAFAGQVLSLATRGARGAADESLVLALGDDRRLEATPLPDAIQVDGLYFPRQPRRVLRAWRVRDLVGTGTIAPVFESESLLRP